MATVTYPVIMPDTSPPMPDTRTSVLLLRSGDGCEPYVRAFGDEGIDAACVDVVRFEFLNEEAMLAALAHPKAHGGLVVTSPRTTMAWARLPEARKRLEAWRHLPVYTVGPRTAREARALGLAPRGAREGSAAALGRFIAGEQMALASEMSPELPLPLLFCCAEERRPELPETLARAGVRLRELVVYRTLLQTDPPAGPIPDWVVFFSPTSMRAASAWPWPWARIRKATVGATSRTAIQEFGWDAEVAASYHDVGALVQGIMRRISHTKQN